MSASSPLSVAAAAVAIGASCHSPPSTSPDHISLHCLPYKPKPIIAKYTGKFSIYPNCYPFSSLSRSVASTESHGVEFSQEEEGNSQETVSDEEENVKRQSAEAGRLYVGNLPFSMTSKQLSEIFEEAGRVVSVEIVYDRVTDRSRGFSFVTMGSVEEAKEAIRLFDGAQIGGRTAKVNFPEVPRGGEREVMSPKIRTSYQGFVDSPHKIYAGNLSWDLTSQGLKEAFEEQPGYLSAKVIYDRDSGRSRGFGFITFSSAEEVESALNNMNGVEVGGRPLRLNLAEQRVPATTPPAVENASESGVENDDMLSGVSS
ncbi:33 kDa ribonucleoprotein, chloroplastic-like [Dorcoceras hygrometricum]|uniref:33 kDa ribonucleoprotein, chloroplastic-like n=1 Tax=Dorcoceras hygrometricum TaxID=472368 RepID=A0A2Z7D774_9LAMI|nr:33 kDa ribonucleoprotein, chloroplastic-like [Dorcoceras hygrometricum]